MKKQKFYRNPWDKEKIEFLLKWWPHFGTYWVAEKLNLNSSQIKAKVDKINLKSLPKTDKLCVDCRVEHQFARYAGLRCRRCHLSRRENIRHGIPVSSSPKSLAPKNRIYKTNRELWIAAAVRTAKHRSKVPSDLTMLFMLALWNKQNGKCYYSGLPLREPIYGDGRKLDAASIDRIDPCKGYTKDNVVWSTLICNIAKNTLSTKEFLNICSLVCQNLPDKLGISN